VQRTETFVKKQYERMAGVESPLAGQAGEVVKGIKFVISLSKTKSKS